VQTNTNRKQGFTTTTTIVVLLVLMSEDLVCWVHTTLFVEKLDIFELVKKGFWFMEGSGRKGWGGGDSTPGIIITSLL
jgi:hypothetical protein